MPPKRTSHSATASFLPTAPTVSSSHGRVNREPAITATCKDVSDEESDEEEAGDGDDDEGGGDHSGDDREQDSDKDRKASPSPPSLRFGPPKGQHHVKSVTSCNHSVNGNILFLFHYFEYLLSFFLFRY